MTSRQLGIAGFVLAVLTAVCTVGLVLASTSVQYGQLLATVTQTQRDVAEIKVTLDKIAPPTVKHADLPTTPATTATTVARAVAVPSEAPPTAQPQHDAEPLPDWHRAFIADKCRLCPTCCATAASGEP